jgi:hypothetical protein
MPCEAFCDRDGREAVQAMASSMLHAGHGSASMFEADVAVLLSPTRENGEAFAARNYGDGDQDEPSSARRLE